MAGTPEAEIQGIMETRITDPEITAAVPACLPAPDSMPDSWEVCQLPMAYTPMQQWKTTYSSKQALNAGTVFPELDLPFQGGRR